MSQGNGKVPDEPPDPAVWIKSQMALALRHVEGRFPGVNVTIFLHDPEKPENFNYVTSASDPAVRAVLTRFLSESRK